MIARLLRASTRRGLSSSSSSSETLNWLQRSKGLSLETSQGVLRAFSPSPSSSLSLYVSISEIQALGDAGLAALVEAVKRQQAPAPATSSSSSSSAVQEVHIKVLLQQQPQHELHFTAREGESLYDLAQRESELARVLECACRGIAACSTCHVYVAKEFRDKLPPPDDSELDMLDLAWGVKKSSRLGCQIKLSRKVEGLVVKIPSQTNNLFG